MYMFTTFQFSGILCLKTSAFRSSELWQGYGSAWNKAKIVFVKKYAISWFLAILGVKVLGTENWKTLFTCKHVTLMSLEKDSLQKCACVNVFLVQFR